MRKKILLLIPLLYSQFAYSACVKTQWANLKDGPGLNYETKWVVPKNTPLKVIEKRNDWYLVEEVDRVRSWVNSNKLTDSYFCGIVKWEKTRIKIDNARKRKLAFYDQAFRILKIQKKYRGKQWALVKNELGTQGWVAKKSLWVH